ncbi:MAG: hypothetical protein JWL69_433 [Phycisphaerales bacterium]|nr:hypothetical protein [Phycisphaerales bacterium]MDB5357194.1 hypothetical protein [Phycisphaerales bacterium]
MSWMKDSGHGLPARALLALLLWATAVRADDAPPIQVGVVAAKSLDAAAAFAKQYGLDLPPPLTAAGLEKQFPFIGQGGLATDKPIGIVLFGGSGVKPDQQMTTFAFPIRPPAITLEALKGLGGKPMPDHPDTVLMNGVGFRRTPDYMVFGPLAAAVANADLDALAGAVKDPGAVARVKIDLKAVRTNMPEQYQSLLDAMRQGALGNAGAAGQAGAGAAIDRIQQAFANIDRVELGLDNRETGVRLSVAAAPLKLPALTPGDLPGMPAGVFARFDLACSPDWLLDADAMQKIADARDQDSGRALDTHQKKKLQDILTNAKALFLGGDAVSIGVDFVGDSPVVYMVSHYASPINYPGDLRKLVEQANAFSTEVHDTGKLTLQTYKLNDIQVVRLVMTENQKPSAYIDAVKQGDNLFLAASDKQFLYIDRLLAVKANGPRQALASGSIDLGKLFDTAGKTSGSPIADMPADQQKRLAELFRDQKVSISFVSEGDGGTFDITIPQGLLKNAPNFVARLAGSAAQGNGTPTSK